MNKILTPVTLSVILGLLVFSACNSETDVSDETDATSVTIASAEYRDLSHRVRTSAKVEPYQRVFVASQISGLVRQVYFEEGDHVQEGDVMAEIDTRLQQIELNRAQIVLAESETNYERSRQLYEREAISESEYLADKREFELAENEVERLEQLIDYSYITAPKNAVVTSRDVEIGNSVSENEQIFEIVDMNNLVIRPGISEMDLSGVEQGQTIDVTLDVYPDHKFESQVRRIFPDVDADSRLFTVELQVKHSDEDPVIRPGYLARVSFSADHQDPALTVPTSAIAERDNETVVFLIDENQTTVTAASVETGVRRDGWTHIISGIEENDTVAAANIDALDDGSAVSVVGEFRRSGFRD
ncbi:efflux RND transporter periplasmic adaptor subunit [Natronogracilivirga saccharolytica]|uniref:Efflux RND transporter periplasmic adaptor subunit n=1 Tax=Natronogracilivirga saccharolytica TaxID=2812953 RepID=A0A8J7RJA6_9BACT|nr:efflux RND transporter periplasmic adaptor subunit [Natronogracilivirga saccharolytica]MBP3191805.1 efflux RND transporter periplasmic adaptor subunit [Natronogracilivirga saccharolytica]